MVAPTRCCPFKSQIVSDIYYSRDMYNNIEAVNNKPGIVVTFKDKRSGIEAKPIMPDNYGVAP